MVSVIALRPRVAALSTALVLAATPATSTAQPPTVSFAGEVARGQAFARGLPGGLAFRLRPDRRGWIIWIGNPDRAAQSYCVVATPPFRGINPLVVHGWHFRNADNTGPNVAGPKNVNAPQHVRQFRFVLTAGDYRAANEALDALLWSAKQASADLARARNTLARIEKGHGMLRLETLALGNLVPGKRAWIERMTFAVELTYPREDGSDRHRN